MNRYWMGVASREHVEKAKLGGFAQVCHGKLAILKHMTEGDWMIYYSPTFSFQGKDPCRSFTAIGIIGSGEPYQFQIAEDFIPWRINVSFLESKDVPIGPLIPNLSFITNKTHWGMPFRRGAFEIPKKDFERIEECMRS